MISVVLKGGIGNQLFQLFAAKALSIQNNQELLAIFALGKKGAFHHGESVNMLQFEFDFDFEFREPGNDLRKRVETRLSKGFPNLYSRINEVLYNYSPDATGFDDKLMNLRGNKLIDGYFQTFKYFNQILRINPDFACVRPRGSTDSFKRLSHLMVEVNPLVLHLRRGDYVGNRNTGLLSQKYYSDSIEALGIGDRPVWIFSDNVALAKKELMFLQSKKNKWISPDELQRPSENLCLMSQSNDIVIGNSTFSYWAASLNNRKNVAAPTKWFQSQKDPHQLYPPLWKQISSSWVI